MTRMHFLKLSTRLWSARALLAALALLLSTSPAAAQDNSSRRARPGAVFFVVSGDASTGEMSVDALVLVERGQFKPPFAEENESARRRFAEQHYQAGREYRLTFGGGDAGTLTIKAFSEGCNNIHASALAETQANIRGRVMGLATDSGTLERRVSSRRAPEPAERAAVLELVNRIYRQRRTPASLLSKIQVTNLTATDLDGDGKHEMVGSFVVETTQKQRRDLFLIAAPQGSGFRADFVHFQAYKLPAEGFARAVDFVDQLDMDGDRVGEVVTIDGGFDAYGYSIFKRRRERWVKVHTGLGDAC